MKRLTPTQLRGHLRSMGWLLYIRDRAVRELHFMQVDKDKLADSDPSEKPERKYLKARELFYGEYGLTEFSSYRVPRSAARDFVRALEKGRVPSWVLATAPPLDELYEAAGKKVQ